MRLSERGAINSALCDGGYNIYPAAKLLDFIKKFLPGEEFKDDFESSTTIKKIRSVEIPGDTASKEIIGEDLDLLISRLEKMNPDYKIEEIFEKMSKDLPQMARHYFSIENYKPVLTKVIEYYFEGYNDIYKNADWIAFNIDPAESKEYGVPIGIYFKRNQVAPGSPEFVVMHENVHQFTAKASMDDITSYYITWIHEGFADIFGHLMLYRITKDWDLIVKTKNVMTEFSVLDSRKATYHYEDNIASQFISTGGLAYTKAFLKTEENYQHDFDWAKVANHILNGKTAHEATMLGYTGRNKSEVEKQIVKWTNEFEKEGQFDENDLRVLRYFSSTQPPATLKPSEYLAVRWLMNELDNNTGSHYLNTKLIGEAGKGIIKKISQVGIDAWNKAPKGHNCFLIAKDDIPADLQESVEKLGNYFFIVKKEYDGKVYFDVYGGSLPYRTRTGELRCTI